MPNFYPILFKFCAYVNNIFMYNIHRDREFPMKTNNLAALFLGLIEPPSYSENIGRYQSLVKISISILQYKYHFYPFLIYINFTAKYKINMYIAPGWGADLPLGSFFFQNHKYSVHVPISIKFFRSNDILTIFPIQMHGRPMLTLP